MVILLSTSQFNKYMRELSAFFVKLLHVHSNFKLNKEETQTCKLALLNSRHVAIFPMVFYKKKQSNTFSWYKKPN